MSSRCRNTRGYLSAGGEIEPNHSPMLLTWPQDPQTSSQKGSCQNHRESRPCRTRTGHRARGIRTMLAEPETTALGRIWKPSKSAGMHFRLVCASQATISNFCEWQEADPVEDSQSSQTSQMGSTKLHRSRRQECSTSLHYSRNTYDWSSFDAGSSVKLPQEASLELVDCGARGTTTATRIVTSEPVDVE